MNKGRDAISTPSIKTAMQTESVCAQMWAHIIESTKDTIRRVDALVERLDETHAIVAAAGGNQRQGAGGTETGWALKRAGGREAMGKEMVPVS